ncbi:19901_t:CDS:2, partial [Funneliformis geosporum]
NQEYYYKIEEKFANLLGTKDAETAQYFYKQYARRKETEVDFNKATFIFTHFIGVEKDALLYCCGIDPLTDLDTDNTHFDRDNHIENFVFTPLNGPRQGITKAYNLRIPADFNKLILDRLLSYNPWADEQGRNEYATPLSASEIDLITEFATPKLRQRNAPD